jgi:MinD-like ATPase involved in chromosome partitioning or flagellar assembly
MSKIVAIHSFRRGTGKSTLIANSAAILARQGLRVGVIDVNLQSPSIHILFGLKEREIRRTLNDYLHGKCAIDESIYDVTGLLVDGLSGCIFLAPASTHMLDIARAVREGYDVNLLNDGFHHLAHRLRLDVLLIDTSAGLNETTMLTLAVADALAVLLRVDRQDFHGTGLIVDLARELEVPRVLMVVNEVPPNYDYQEVRTTVERNYGSPVAAVLPFCDEMMALTGNGLFAANYPAHPVTTALKRVTRELVA